MEEKVEVCTTKVETNCTRKNYLFKYSTGYYPHLLNSSAFSRGENDHLNDEAEAERIDKCNGQVENPVSLPTAEGSVLAPRASSLKMGAWLLGRRSIDELVGDCDKTPVPLNATALRGFETRAKQPPPYLNEGAVTVGKSGKDNYWLYSCTPEDEKIGCIRFSFSTVAVPRLSLIYAVQGGQFADYIVPETRLCDAQRVSAIEIGRATKKELFDVVLHKRKTNLSRRWAWRLLGFFIIWIGMYFIFHSIDWISSFLPPCDTFRGLNNTIRHPLIVGLSLALSLVTVSLLWWLYRMYIGAMLLGLGIALITAAFFIAQSQRIEKDKSLKKFQRASKDSKNPGSGLSGYPSSNFSSSRLQLAATEEESTPERSSTKNSGKTEDQLPLLESYQN